MNWLRHLSAGWLIVLLLCAGGVIVEAQSGSRRAQPIEFFDANLPVASSNLNQSSRSSANPLGGRDNRFDAPYRIGGDNASEIERAKRTLPSQVPRSLDPRVVRDLMDNRKSRTDREEWLLEPSDDTAIQEPTLEELFGIAEPQADGTERSPDKSSSRPWDRTENQRYGNTNRMSNQRIYETTDEQIKSQARIIFGMPVMPEGGAGLSGSDSTVPRSLNPSPASTLIEFGDRQSAGGMFPTTPGAQSSARAEANTARLEEYRQMFEVMKPSAPVSPGMFGDASGGRSARPGSFGDPGSSSAPKWETPALPSMSGFGSSLRPETTRPSGIGPETGLSPTLPTATQRPRPAAPPAGFQLPKRSF